MTTTSEGPGRLVLLGTTGGVTWYPQTGRASSSSALEVGDSIYLVDLPAQREGALDINKSGFDESRLVYTDSADPALVTPTPGIRQTTDLIWQALAQTINDMMLDNAYPDFRSLVEVQEIGMKLPTQDSPTCPVTAPFLVYPRDEIGVEVWATLVGHHQVCPSFAFRFDTPGGSVVFSGDTGANTSGNLQALASGADLLVPAVMPVSRLQKARNGFSGRLIVGSDLIQTRTFCGHLGPDGANPRTIGPRARRHSAHGWPERAVRSRRSMTY